MISNTGYIQGDPDGSAGFSALLIDDLFWKRKLQLMKMGLINGYDAFNIVTKDNFIGSLVF